MSETTMNWPVGLIVAWPASVPSGRLTFSTEETFNSCANPVAQPHRSSAEMKIFLIPNFKLGYYCGFLLFQASKIQNKSKQTRKKSELFHNFYTIMTIMIIMIISMIYSISRFVNISVYRYFKNILAYTIKGNPVRYTIIN